jgi:hypothetical protein
MLDCYERRAINPSLALIEQAAKALGMSVAELLGREPQTTRCKPGLPPSSNHALSGSSGPRGRIRNLSFAFWMRFWKRQRAFEGGVIPTESVHLPKVKIKLFWRVFYH